MFVQIISPPKNMPSTGKYPVSELSKRMAYAFKRVLDLYSMSNNDFKDKTGVDANIVSRLMGGHQKTSTPLFEALRGLGVNERFLNAGQGPVFAYEKKEELDYVDEPIPIYEPKNNLPIEAKPYTSIRDFVEIPLIPVSARAGIDMSVSEVNQLEMKSKFVHLSESEKKLKELYVIEVDGDSMNPSYYSGDTLLMQLIPPERWVYQQNNVYAIWYDETFTIKQVFKNEMENGFLNLYPHNIKVESFTIKSEQIRHIFKLIKPLDVIPRPFPF